MVGLKYTIKRKYVNTQTLAKSEFSKTVTTLRIKDTSDPVVANLQHWTLKGLKIRRKKVAEPLH